MPVVETNAVEHAGHQHGASAQNDVIYICPMVEHLAIQYTHAGKCPLCGMTLVPVSRELLAKIQPGGKVEYYVCPMPEHADLKSPKPGKCTRCGMTMIPIMTAPAIVPETGHHHDSEQ
jgi:rubrerythrin